MKHWRHLIGCVALISLGGCNADDTNQGSRLVDTDVAGVSQKAALVLSYGMAHVEVMPYNSVHLKRQQSYDVGLHVTYGDGVQRARTLRLAKSSGPGRDGIETSLWNGDGELLISVTQQWGITADSTYTYFLHEMTPSDALTLTAGVSGASVTESYEFNGDRLDLAYVFGSPSQDEAIEAFAEFYGQNAVASAGSLDNNAEGSMMMTLVNDTAFVNWALHHIRPAQERGPLPKVACDLECICYLATVCSMVKCPAGWFMNPVCDGCLMVTGACAVVKLIREVF